jgi:hypothetical protein
MSSEKYVKQAVADVKTKLNKVDQCLLAKVMTPVSQGYRPELDQLRELEPKRGKYYQSLIGVLHWICELGRINILVAVSMLSRFVVSPREGHQQQLFHIFAYLKHHTHSRMVLDNSEPVYDENSFKIFNWAEYYPDTKEAILNNAPMERGNGVVTSCFVNADHAGCKATQTKRLFCGILSARIRLKPLLSVPSSAP